jgi:hypothetical protein
MESLFRQALAEVQASDYVPQGYFVSPEEWNGEQYPEVEVIPVGSNRKVPIKLPVMEWYLRAVKWAQAVELMNIFLTEIGS